MLTNSSSRSFAICADLRRLGLVGIGDGGGPLGKQRVEQAELGPQVIVECVVVVEVVAREIGEAAGRKPHAIEAPLLQPVARRFDGEVSHVISGEVRHDLV